MRTTIGMTVLGLALTAAAPLDAQSWDSPSFFSPRPGEDIGLYVVRPQLSNADLGFHGIWRQSGNINLGVRAGIAGSDHISVGAEFYGPLNIGAGSGLLLSWVGGVGATFNEVTALRVPLGLSVGVQLGGASLSLLPYVHPRVAFDLMTFDNVLGEEETRTEFNIDIDIGADAELGTSFVLRVGASIAETNTFGIGIAYKLPRRVEVR